MEEGQLAFFLGFDERIQIAIFEPRLNKCLSKIVAILEEVEDAALHINHDSNDAADFKIAKVRLRLLLNRIVVIPLAARVDVTRGKVHAPEVTRPRHILIEVEGVAAEANDDFGVDVGRHVRILRLLNLVNSILEIEDVRQLLGWNHMRFHRLWNLIAMPIKVVKLGC